MKKSECRAYYKNTIHNIENRKEKDEAIANSLLSLDLIKDSKNIGVYVSMDIEVDTYQIIKKLLEAGKSVFIPKLKGREMVFTRLYTLADLDMTNNYNIKETSYEIITENLEVCIIPALMFDLNLYRVGHGMGYYDKYLEAFPDCVTIGIIYDELVLKDDVIEHDDFDVSISMIVTDKEIYE